MKSLLSLFLSSCFLCFFYAVVAVLMPGSAFSDNGVFSGYGFQSTFATAKRVEHNLGIKSALEITFNPDIPDSVKELNIVPDIIIDITDMIEDSKINIRREKISASETTSASKVRSLSSDVFSFLSEAFRLII
jgi:hypothetical protein